jgi:small subunit ribosomal protein S2
MSLPHYTMRQLLEAGVHFGHQPRRWNPKMKPYIYGEHNRVHIIDLQKTVPMLHQAMEAVKDVIAKGGRVLFVGTKRQAADKVAEAAKACGQPYVNHRWLGGMLTNWKTISKSIHRLEDLEKQLEKGETGLTKKEMLSLTREKLKLDLALGGIREMGGRPDILFIIDTNKESIAIEEARKLGIPIIAVVDTNSNPDYIDYLIPGNDDASRAIELYCQLIAGSVLAGLQAEMAHKGKDLGASVEVPADIIPAAEAEVSPAANLEALAEEILAKDAPIEAA